MVIDRAVVERAFDGRAHTYDLGEMHRRLAESVASFVDLDGVRDVLDVATGTGLLLRALPPDGLRFSGTDISQRMLDEAVAHLPAASFRRAEASQLPFADASFDLVTCVSAMPYLDPLASFAEWRRLIRPAGRIVITAWETDGIPSAVLLRTAAQEHGIALQDPNAATGSLAELEGIAKGADLRILRCNRWSYLAQAPDAAEMVNQIAPFGRTALNDASPEVRRAVERTLGELISETRSFEQHSLFVELSVAR
ncbi:class I SAM-dependent methyltransferase [Microcella humidisoli]|uniref:Methyltransferase domain-containing protein n=2 Tax=Microcella humidisoli TaxID=2963406 RepID=A0ABY5FW54_9MICO|nr:methyltransferase domain-containing protein [Microcella humidisoli]UTT62530.1 methyltransferase domain-containing protein [Microcella humidisoli]